MMSGVWFEMAMSGMIRCPSRYFWFEEAIYILEVT